MFWVIFILVLTAFGIWAMVKLATWQHHAVNEGLDQVACPSCGSRGTVTAMPVTRKRGISGGKATGAVLTGGTSMLATGLWRKERGRALACSSCHSRWDQVA